MSIITFIQLPIQPILQLYVPIVLFSLVTSDILLPLNPLILASRLSLPIRQSVLASYLTTQTGESIFIPAPSTSLVLHSFSYL